MSELQLTQPDDTANVIKEIEDAFFDIPFENSDFQNEAFVIAAQITPERAYRAIGLRLHAKLRALQEAQFSKELAEIQLEELQEQINDLNRTSFDRRRSAVELRKIQAGRSWTDKLINDAVREVTLLYKHLQALPKFTREQFEAGERKHFEQRLTRQYKGLTGPAEALVNMQTDLPAMEQFQSALALLPPESRNTTEGIEQAKAGIGSEALLELARQTLIAVQQ